MNLCRLPVEHGALSFGGVDIARAGSSAQRPRRVDRRSAPRVARARVRRLRRPRRGDGGDRRRHARVLRRADRRPGHEARRARPDERRARSRASACTSGRRAARRTSSTRRAASGFRKPRVKPASTIPRSVLATRGPSADKLPSMDAASATPRFRLALVAVVSAALLVPLAVYGAPAIAKSASSASHQYRAACGQYGSSGGQYGSVVVAVPVRLVVQAVPRADLPPHALEEASVAPDHRVVEGR